MMLPSLSYGQAKSSAGSRPMEVLFRSPLGALLAKPWVGDLYAREAAIDRVIP